MDINNFKNKKVFVKLYGKIPNTVRVYTGVVEEITYLGKDEKGKESWLFLIKDKFGETVGFSTNEIKFIETER